MTDIPPAQPMTRRERRQLEEQGLLPGNTASTPLEQAEPSPVAELPSPPVLPISTSAPAVPPLIPPAPPVPMTRRERKMLEETGVIPIPPQYLQESDVSALDDTSLVDVTQSVAAESPSVPVEPLPPVFGPPTTSPTIISPPPAPDNASVTSPTTGPTSGPTSPSRIVGDVTMATSSLILPTTPTVDVSGPIGDTGEVIVTGQITLPHRLAETGTIPTLREDRDDDEHFDAYVTGELAAMSQPIRASKAVSGQGDDTDILLVRRVRWGTAAILTATGAAVLGLGAVALLVIALLTDALV